MLDLSSIPNNLLSKEAELFSSLKKLMSIQLSIPSELKDRLENFLHENFSESEIFVESDKYFYRARIHEFNQKNSFIEEKMGAPPKEKSSLGRIQFAGNSVLYTAKEVDTAIAEVRPSVGSRLTIAKFYPNKDTKIRILDLTKYKSLENIVSPSELIIKITALLSAMNFSEKEFSKQVHPDDQRRYLDTIYITKILRDKGFDGIAYKSLLNHGGLNYAFFTPACLTCKLGTEVLEVTSLKLTHKHIFFSD